VFSLVAIVLVLVAVLAPWPLTTLGAAVAVAQTVSASPPVNGARININTAGVKELMTLAGVSRGLAEKIVKHRETNGLFKKPGDLRHVDGVGGELWEKNRARIVVK
jgi:competence ComEA-like helix-hairpin-helix protein